MPRGAPGKRRAKLNKEGQIERERRIWALRQQALTHERIASDVGVDRTTVTKTLGRLSRLYLAELEEDIASEKMQQVAMLHRMADEAMQAWERSKKSGKRITARRGGAGENGSGGAVISMVQDRDGDPRYLAAARDALADVRKILGLDAPRVQTFQSPGGAPLPTPVTTNTIVVREYLDSDDDGAPADAPAAEN